MLSPLKAALSSLVMMYPTSFFSHSLYFFGSFVESLANAAAKHIRTVIKKANLRMLCDYLRLESDLRQRVICENDSFAVLVPFWAVWPFETLLISKRHTESIADLDNHERDQLGEVLQQITIRYDNLFEVSFPYSMGFHQRPTDGERHPEWHLHAHFYPPLLRSATIQKFMVGFEMLGGPQRDITPEAAADRLQNVSKIHFRDRA